MLQKVRWNFRHLVFFVHDRRDIQRRCHIGHRNLVQLGTRLICGCAALTCYWDEAEDTTTYNVQLYCGSTKIGSTKTTSEAEYDFTSLILEKGSGTYYFTVYPTKGGTDDMIESDTLQLTSSEISDLKSYYTTDSEDTLTAMNTSDDNSTTANASSDSSTTGWVQLTDGRWQYSSDSSMVRGCLPQILEQAE